MKEVDNRFICTDKEMADLIIIDRMFHATGRGLACSECPFVNKREDCTVSLFLKKIMELTRFEKRSST